jgi:hypothetical protein
VRHVCRVHLGMVEAPAGTKFIMGKLRGKSGLWVNVTKPSQPAA